MAKKKSQDDAPNPSSVQNRDIMQRLNYLYQASVLLGSTTSFDNRRSQTSHTSTEWGGPSRRELREREKLKQRHPSTMVDLSRTYVRSMKVIGRKTTVRMDPSVKRTLCKKCEIVLVPGTTALVRVNPSGQHGHVLSYTCLACQTSRRIPAPAEPREEPESAASNAVAASSDHRESESNDDMSMGIVTANAPAGGDRPRPFQKKRKRPVTKLPPLFARKDAGHIVFRGNERLE